MNVVFLEESEDVLGGLERGVAGGTVGQHSDPDRDATGNGHYVAVCALLFPPEAGDVDGGMFDLLIVEEFNNLGTNGQSAECYASRRSRTSSRIVFQKLFWSSVVVHFKMLHNARVVLWPRRWRKDIRRRPEDELGAKKSVVAETKVVKVLLELGDIV